MGSSVLLIVALFRIGVAPVVYIDGWAEQDAISAETNRSCYLG